MAPFPESEDMTIKRLKVAIRKKDYQLLKMGTYKLHEKFHTGYEFELTDDLRQILDFVEANNFPPEISDILCSTIKDILSKKAMKELDKTEQIMPENAGQNNFEENLKEEVVEEKQAAQPSKETPSVKNSGVFGPVDVVLPKRQNNLPPSRNAYYEYVRKEAKSVEQIHNQEARLQQAFEQYESTKQNYQKPEENSLFRLPPEPQPKIQEQKPQIEAQIETQPQIQPEAQIQEQEEALPRFKNIVLFYDDYNNEIDFSKVKDYKNNLNLLFSKSENSKDYNILKQISTLTHNLDTSIQDIQKIISMLTTAKGRVFVVTASQSQNISRLLYEKNIDFEIPFVKKPRNKNSAFNFIPMSGSTNIFVCSNCNLRTLKTDFNTRTLSVQCPHCDSAAFPDIYAINSYNPDCNPAFWHRAFAAFIQSPVWILVNPPLDENREIYFDFLKTAYGASTPEKVYILSKENDKKEFYRQTFMSINEECKVKTHFQNEDRLCEEFINEEIIKRSLI